MIAQGILLLLAAVAMVFLIRILFDIFTGR